MIEVINKDELLFKINTNEISTEDDLISACYKNKDVLCINEINEVINYFNNKKILISFKIKIHKRLLKSVETINNECYKYKDEFGVDDFEDLIQFRKDLFKDFCKLD